MVRVTGISFNILFIHVNGTVNCFTTETVVPEANVEEAVINFFHKFFVQKIRNKNFVIAFYIIKNQQCTKVYQWRARKGKIAAMRIKFIRLVEIITPDLNRGDPILTNMDVTKEDARV